jgi:hypothetical protein
MLADSKALTEDAPCREQIGALLENYAIESEEDETEENKNSVTLSTIHSAKVNFSCPWNIFFPYDPPLNIFP